MPKKNKQSSTASNLLSGITGGNDSDASSVSSVSTMGTVPGVGQSMKNLTVSGHRRNLSAATLGRASPRSSMDERPNTPGPASDEVRYRPNILRKLKKLTATQPILLWRENQRISLRAFLRTLLSNPQIANTRAIQDFLSFQPITPADADVEDIARRKAMDEKRVEEQKQFYEIARKRAAELDVYMEQYVMRRGGMEIY